MNALLHTTLEILIFGMTININGLDDNLTDDVHRRIKKAFKRQMSEAKSRQMRTIALQQGGCVQSNTYILVPDGLYLNPKDILHFDGGYIIGGIYIS